MQQPRTPCGSRRGTILCCFPRQASRALHSSEVTETHTDALMRDAGVTRGSVMAAATPAPQP